MTADLAALLEATGNREMQREYKRLLKYRDLALAMTGFTVGQRVALTRSFAQTDTTSGWYIYREVLVAGNTGHITRIDFNEWHGNRWFAHWQPEVCWAVGSYRGGTRYPDDVPRIFAMWLDHLRPAHADDRPVHMPEVAEV